MSNSKPKRIQLSRKRGWRKPDGAVVVSRPGKWGNPYVVERRDDWESKWLVVHKQEGVVMDCFSTKPEAASLAVEYYRLDLMNGDLNYTQAVVRSELRGKDLCCWCPIGSLCHADVLLEIANS